MVLPFLAPFSGWAAVSSLGQAQTLLPLALAFGGLIAWRANAGAVAAAWLGWLGVAASLVVVTKVAYMGWGIGSERFDFIGVSGHAMCAAAVYPLLFYSCVTRGPRARRWLALAVGCAVALLVAYSRLRVHAHSVSEVLAGVAIGGAVSWWALRQARELRVRMPMFALAIALLWVAPVHWNWRGPGTGPHATPEDAIIWLAMEVSGRSRPYTREDLHERAAARRSSAKAASTLAHHAV